MDLWNHIEPRSHELFLKHMCPCVCAGVQLFALQGIESERFSVTVFGEGSDSWSASATKTCRNTRTSHGFSDSHLSRPSTCFTSTSKTPRHCEAKGFGSPQAASLHPGGEALGTVKPSASEPMALIFPSTRELRTLLQDTGRKTVERRDRHRSHRWTPVASVVFFSTQECSGEVYEIETAISGRNAQVV